MKNGLIDCIAPGESKEVKISTFEESGLRLIKRASDDDGNEGDEDDLKYVVFERESARISII